MKKNPSASRTFHLQYELIRALAANSINRRRTRQLAPFVSCAFCVRADQPVVDAAELLSSGWRAVEERQDSGGIRNPGTYCLACPSCSPSHREATA